jgi:hypothetical protein
MKQQVDDARLVITAEQPAIQPLKLRADARERRDAGKKWIEQRGPHRLSIA